ncbi:MAG: hypothetical protein LBS68_00625 [Puniceicoccales bacterium]|jgi:hypothetical protein|nr:hypothetical protein [Puniceicoccales bacterium]
MPSGVDDILARYYSTSSYAYLLPGVSEGGNNTDLWQSSLSLVGAASQYALNDGGDDLQFFSKGTDGIYAKDDGGHYVKRSFLKDGQLTFAYVHISQLYQPTEAARQNMGMVYSVLGVALQASRIIKAQMEEYLDALDKCNAELRQLQELYEESVALLVNTNPKLEYSTAIAEGRLIRELAEVGAVMPDKVFCSGLDFDKVRDLFDDIGVHETLAWRQLYLAWGKYEWYRKFAKVVMTGEGPRIVQVPPRVSFDEGSRMHSDGMEDHGYIGAYADGHLIPLFYFQERIGKINGKEPSVYYINSSMDADVKEREMKLVINRTSGSWDVADRVSLDVAEQEYVARFLSAGPRLSYTFPSQDPAIMGWVATGDNPNWTFGLYQDDQCIINEDWKTDVHNLYYDPSEMSSTPHKYKHKNNGNAGTGYKNDQGKGMSYTWNVDLSGIRNDKKARAFENTDTAYVNRIELHSITDNLRMKIDSKSNDLQIPNQYVGIANNDMQAIFSLATQVIQEVTSKNQQTAGNVRL